MIIHQSARPLSAVEGCPDSAHVLIDVVRAVGAAGDHFSEGWWVSGGTSRRRRRPPDG
ncbi:hypothetical protein Ae406Ps2_4450 [Pseudonocardia sp. Ae406_Ps2]|nr:hypothetical protein Ae331Ps2_1505c [Pseudonocardia sp. Ae331_Ps2]OLL97842.1 hypothetical protein Ae331Ps2_1509c [Pseudonocardia sp. Ae331_Ps2]OLM04450.1 hypothetical protein Ae406Ps2_4450 [Pseudonocardia sp. Ae406_Ps2]OLM26012.1 hypothetical protein Ae706Ps2_4445 [Pseudonocardia sp. Ae706_Ps2]